MDEIISRHCLLTSKASALLQLIPLLHFSWLEVLFYSFWTNTNLQFSAIFVFISPQAFSEKKCYFKIETFITLAPLLLFSFSGFLKTILANIYSLYIDQWEKKAKKTNKEKKSSKKWKRNTNEKNANFRNK